MTEDNEIETIIKVLEMADSMTLTVKGQKVALGPDIIGLLISAIKVAEEMKKIYDNR